MLSKTDKCARVGRPVVTVKAGGVLNGSGSSYLTRVQGEKNRGRRPVCANGAHARLPWEGRERKTISVCEGSAYVDPASLPRSRSCDLPPTCSLSSMAWAISAIGRLVFMLAR